VTADANRGRVATWRAENLMPYGVPGPRDNPYNALFGVSCPAISLCALVRSKGTIFTSTNRLRPGEPTGSIAIPSRNEEKDLESRFFTETGSTPDMRQRDSLTFRFHANATVRRYLCRLDASPFRRCGTPHRIYVPVGVHAIGVTGLKGPTTSNRFRVVRVGQTR
jgi:hypothetical protein